MNLNEFVINPGNKPKSRTKFITINKSEDDSSITNNNSRLNFSKQGKHVTAKNNSTVSSAPNWGSAFASVTSSSRKSSSSKATEEASSRTIVALTEGRGQARCEVGIAVMNISNPVLVICQISDSQNYINTLMKINIFNPTDILFPNTFERNISGNRLIKKIRERFPNTKYSGIPRGIFNKTSGLYMLSRLCLPSLSGVSLIIRHRYYALAATSALLSYIQDNLYIFYATGSLKVDYQESEGYAIIDVATADRLELVCSTRPAQANKYSSLLGILNHCRTKIGTRMLRSWILQPPSNVIYIRERLDCVEELMTNIETLSSIQALLQNTNLETLLNLASLVPEDPQKCTNRQINYILKLNTIIDLVNPLTAVLSNLKQPFFIKVKKTLKDKSFDEVKEMVKNIISTQQPFKGESSINQRCFAVKPGVNELLDVVRKIYSERVSDMKDYVQILVSKYNMDFTLGNNNKKGYHIILHLKKNQRKDFKKSDLPQEFFEVKHTAMSFTMKTSELVNFSTRIDDIVEDILKISNVIVYGVLVKLKNKLPLFYTLCDEIAQLDVYQSLAQTSLENHYIRPEFGEFTNIKEGLHPLLNFLLPTKPVGNTLFCSDDYNVHIITGPNGSGKSIFIRQTMLLQIMAQLGCYVPAESATFKPVNKMFARIYLDDNMEVNASSYVLEMKEIKYIMSTMTKDSLIIIDELGRSTCVEDGISMAIGILEKMSCFSSYIFVTTHFTTFAKLHLIYPHIKTWQMETIPYGEDPKTFKLDYKYRLMPGITQIDRYGVYLVRNIWPDSIVKIVDDSLDRMEKPQNKTLYTPLDQKSIIKYDTESEFRHLKRQRLLCIPKIREISLRYQLTLKQLNCHISNIYAAKTKPTDELELTDFEDSIINTQEYLRRQEQKFEKIFTPDYSNQHQNTFPLPRSGESFNRSFDSSINSDFLRLLSPIVSIREPCPNLNPLPSKQIPPEPYSKFQLLPSESPEIQNFQQLQPEPVLNLQLLPSKSPESYPNLKSPEKQLPPSDTSSIDYFVNSPEDSREIVSQNILNEYSFDGMAEKNTYKYYVSPVVKVIEGLNNTTMSESDFQVAVNNQTKSPNRIQKRQETTSTTPKVRILKESSTKTKDSSLKELLPQNSEKSWRTCELQFPSTSSLISTQNRKGDEESQRSIFDISTIPNSPQSNNPETTNKNKISDNYSYDKITLNNLMIVSQNVDKMNEIKGKNNIVPDDISPIPNQIMKRFARSTSNMSNDNFFSSTPITDDQIKETSLTSFNNHNSTSYNLLNKTISFVTPRHFLSLKQSQLNVSTDQTFSKIKEQGGDVIKKQDFNQNSGKINVSIIEKNDKINLIDDKNKQYSSISSVSKKRNLDTVSPNSKLTNNNQNNSSLSSSNQSLNKYCTSDTFKTPTPVTKSIQYTKTNDFLNKDKDIEELKSDKDKFRVATDISFKSTNNNENNSPFPSSNHQSSLYQNSTSNIPKTPKLDSMDIEYAQINKNEEKHFKADASKDKKRNLDSLSVPSSQSTNSNQNNSSNYEKPLYQTSVSSTPKTPKLVTSSAQYSKTSESIVLDKNEKISDDQIQLAGEELESSNSSLSKKPNLDSPFNINSKSTSSTPKIYNLGDQYSKTEDLTTVLNKNTERIESSISSVSKKRKLDSLSDPNSKSTNNNPSLTSSNHQSSFYQNSTPKTPNMGDQYSKIIDLEEKKADERKDLDELHNSISIASKNRNLDSPTDSNSKSTITNQNNSMTSISTVSRQRNLDFVASTSKSTETSNESKRIILPKKLSYRKKFVPPRKLTAKQIKQDFEQQDREILQSTPTSSNISKYLAQRINRPTVKQIQNTTYLGSFRKTAKGIEVIRTESETRKHKITKTKCFSNKSFDMTIFSDKNANAFEEFINSKETDFRNFRFNTQKQSEKPFFSFKKENDNVFDYFMANSQSKESTNRQTSDNTTLTPNGFYKENKNDIDNLMNKYLPSPYLSKSNNFGFKKTNIFGNNHLSDDDLDL